MTRVIHTTSAPIMYFFLGCLLFFCTAYTAAASEITGTLSSDGSNDNQTSAVVTNGNENSGVLQGSVIGGVSEESRQTTKENLMWSALAVLLITTSYLWWTRHA